MLISRKGHIIYTWNISPIPTWRYFTWLYILIWLFVYNKWFHFLRRFSLTVFCPRILLFVNYFILNWWICCISFIICPCIIWRCPKALRFNTHIICSSNNLEKTFITPIFSPRIPSNPIWSTLFSETPSYYRNPMLSVVLISCCIIEYSSSIINKLLCYSHTTYNRTPLLNFIHHILFPTECSHIKNSIYFGILLSPTTIIRCTIFALYYWGAS